MAIRVDCFMAVDDAEFEPAVAFLAVAVVDVEIGLEEESKALPVDSDC